MASTRRAAGFPALGVATNKHGQVRMMDEQSIIDYDRGRAQTAFGYGRRARPLYVQGRKLLPEETEIVRPQTTFALANLRPSSSVGSLGLDGMRPGSSMGDVLGNCQGDTLKPSASAASLWPEASRLAMDPMNNRMGMGSRASTAMGFQSLGPGDELDGGIGARGIDFGARPNSTQIRTAPLRQKRPGARVGSGAMFMPKGGQCFCFQIGETPSCSAFGNQNNKDPPAAGFKYWRDFKGSGGHFLGM
mmetsp:Transcript_89222/g.163577  ORF Transcript_89222/g.163577 Transcript_89222/m.163577 type:complete len:247 (-) Transcript_89222:231-971(-)